MAKVVGVRFRNAGKVYYFNPLDWELRHGDMVVVETAMGNECGRVVLSVREVPDEKVTKPLRPVIRKADEKDVEREAELRKKETEAFHICKKKIREHGLDMKLVAAEYTFDGKKILFYFTADGRVDFRELVRDLASAFKVRIELRQIGVRDETRILGGVGICGRQLCCSSYLTDFVPVSIRMAKEQNLSLNPGKISGVCGRLMCCLKNEEETYEYLNRNLPGIGDTVSTPDDRVGTVSSVNILRQQIRVLIEEGDEKNMEEYPADELTLIAKKKKGQKQQPKKKQAEAVEGDGNEKKKGRGGEKAGAKNGEKAAEKNGERSGEKRSEDETARNGRGRNRRKKAGMAAGDMAPHSGMENGHNHGNVSGAGAEHEISVAERSKRHDGEMDERHGAAAGPEGTTAEVKHRRRRRRRRSGAAAGENNGRPDSGAEHASENGKKTDGGSGPVEQ